MLDPATRRILKVFGFFLWTIAIFGLGEIIGLGLAQKRIECRYESHDGRWLALVRSHFTLTPPRQSFWIRDLRTAEETRLADLHREDGACNGIVWSPESDRVGFLVEGAVLMLYDPADPSSLRRLELLAPGERGEGLAARGLVFLPARSSVRYDVCRIDRAGVLETRELGY
jgi:hypothetical protein